MATKLSDITTNYRRFTKNQVLTEGQLNEMVNYFDDQDRLSRIMLSGVGLLCGFEVSYSKSASNITISQGTAITTDGDLLKFYTGNGNRNELQLSSNIYRYFKPYDNKEANYTPYFYKNGEQLEIYELFTLPQINASSEALKEEVQELEELIGKKIPLNDAVVLLYLEEYDKEKDLCVSLSCDNQGVEVNHKLKALLVSSAVAKYIMQFDSIRKKQPNFHLKALQNLPDLIANRVLMQPEDFSDYEELKEEFTKEVFKNDVAISTLKAYKEVYQFLNLSSWYQVFEQGFEYLFKYRETEVIPPDFQYRYDLLKDLIDTYNEIKEALHCVDYSASCTPDIKAFPKHIMLGKIVEEKTGEYRHNFYKSPIFKKCQQAVKFPNISTGADVVIKERVWNLEATVKLLSQSQNLEQAKLYSLLKRSVQLVFNYNANFTNIRITPSFELGRLSKKAIPFYNNVGQHLINLWDIEKTLVNEQDTNTSYHTEHLLYKKPLELNIDADFYRIEGHQGKNYKEVVKTLQHIRDKHNLSFNIVALKVRATKEQSHDFLHAYTEQYLKRNHGYEHKAGIVPGGTFILIYIDSDYDDYPRPYGYGYPYDYPEPISLSGDFEGREVEDPMIVTTPVVADFSIPYLCCDENLIDLSLPIKHLCFDNSTLPIPFMVMPKRGYVEAEVEEGLDGGVVLNQYGEFVFDPKLVSEELYGKPIKFTVNNFETNYAITIHKKPQFSFIVDTLGEPASDRTIKVTFVILQEAGQEGIEYTWDFGDGSDQITSTKLGASHTYFLEEDFLKIEVVLIGKKNGCSSTYSEKLVLEIPKVELSLPEKHVCFDKETKPLPFAVLPKNGEVQAVVDDGLNGGVTTNDAGAYLFDPNLVSPKLYGTPINFTVNGFSTDCFISASPKPTFIFEVVTLGEPIDGTVTVTFNIIQETPVEGTEYIWNFGDGSPVVTTSKTSIAHTYTVTRGGIKPLVVVQAIAGVCTSQYSEIVPVEIPTEIGVSIEPTTFCRQGKDVPFIITPPEAIVNLGGEGVTVDNNGKWVFSPSQTSSSSITVFVNGNPSSLVLTVSDIVMPQFNAFIEGELLIIENLSQITDIYRWDINGVVTERKTRRRIEIQLAEIPKAKEQIVITMQTVSLLCGESDKETAIVTVPVSNTCYGNVDGYVKDTTAEYSQLTVELTDAMGQQVTTEWENFKVFLSSVTQLRDQMKVDRNARIDFRTYFETDLFVKLTETLGVLELPGDPEALSFLDRAYIKSLYLLWCCASKQNQDFDIAFVTQTEEQMQSLLKKARVNEFNIDKNDTLKPFLRMVSEECAQQPLIPDSVANSLVNLNFAGA